MSWFRRWRLRRRIRRHRIALIGARARLAEEEARGLAGRPVPERGRVAFHETFISESEAMLAELTRIPRAIAGYQPVPSASQIRKPPRRARALEEK